MERAPGFMGTAGVPLVRQASAYAFSCYGGSAVVRRTKAET